MTEKRPIGDFLTTMAKLLLVLLIVTLVATGKIDLSDISDTQGVPHMSQAATEAALTPWDADLAPDFVVTCGRSDLSEHARSLEPGEVTYATDDLGRPTEAAGNITYKMYREGSDRERDDLPNPVGWPKNAEVVITFPRGGTYHGWLWNRSHLLAKSLGGDDIRDNLVAGTRCQNVGRNDGDGGMAYPETLARTWLAKNKTKTLIYSARPIYVGDEPIPRSVIVDILSSDSTIDAQYVVYNAAPGFTIDYANSTWTQDGREPTTYDFAESFRDLLRGLGIET